MEITDAIRVRRSIRAFKPEPVPKEVLVKIIETCQWTGSAHGSQPWEFTVVSGDAMKKVKDRLAEMMSSTEPDDVEFPMGMPIPELYKQRADAFYTARENYQWPPGTKDLEQKRNEYSISRAKLFDAPNAIMVYTEKELMVPWELVSIGMMVQSICIDALNYGLGTCVMGARRPRLIRQLLDIPQSKDILVWICIGYPDYENRVNNFPRPRIPLDSWVRWKGK